MSEVSIPLKKFVSNTIVFCGDESEEQISIHPPVYNKEVIAEGYDSYIKGKLELPDQVLEFTQESSDSLILLKELRIQMKNFSASLTNLVYKSHYDPKFHKALLKALADKRKE